MSLHNLTFITFTLLLVANVYCSADKNESLIDSQNVTSSEVSATLLEHINNSGKLKFSISLLEVLLILYFSKKSEKTTTTPSTTSQATIINQTTTLNVAAEKSR